MHTLSTMDHEACPAVLSSITAPLSHLLLCHLLLLFLADFQIDLLQLLAIFSDAIPPLDVLVWCRVQMLHVQQPYQGQNTELPHDDKMLWGTGLELDTDLHALRNSQSRVGHTCSM